jgi:hypothetical protein
METMQRVKGGVGYHYAIFSANVFKYDVVYGCDVMFPRSDLKGHGNLIIGITSKRGRHDEVYPSVQVNSS